MLWVLHGEQKDRDETAEPQSKASRLAYKNRLGTASFWAATGTRVQVRVRIFGPADSVDRTEPALRGVLDHE